MHIRPATPDDLDAITAIYAEAVLNGAGSYELDPPDRATMEERMAQVLAAGFPYIVAEDEAGILGYAYASHYRTRPAYRFLAEDSIYVAPAAKGKGVGKALLTELIEACDAIGFYRMIAVIGDGGVNVASVALHRSLGFVECGRISGSGFKHGRWLDTVFMQRDLPGAEGRTPSAQDYPLHHRKPQG